MCVIRVNNVTKYYRGKTVLNKCDFIFEKGKNYLIKGASGAGKTTLLNLICGYDKPDDGEIEKNPELKIEYLFQDDLLFSNLTVRQNLEIKCGALQEQGCELPISNVRFVLEKFGMSYQENQKISELSGGERQRIQLLFAILGKSDVILLDEPTSKLDLENKKVVLDFLEENFQEQTVLLVSHENLETIFSCDVVLLNGGKLQSETI